MGMDFFEQLRTFSLRYFESLGIVEQNTPWGPMDYEHGAPRGAIVHYTADDDIDRVVRWFMQEKFRSQVSAHVVIADRRYPRTGEMVKDLPLVAALPTTVIQCALPGDPTWHARWASKIAYGIELLNVGELRENADSQLCSHWRRDHDPDEPEWSMPWRHPIKRPLKAWHRHWEPYSIDQTVSLVAVLRHLLGVYPDISPGLVVGHECVQENKRDPGPGLPMHQIRAAMFGDKDALVQEPGGLASIKREQIVCEFAAALVGPTNVVDERTGKVSIIPPEMPPPEIAWAQFHDSIQALKDRKKPFGMVGKTALKLLGYHVPLHIHRDMHDTDREAIWLFQKAMGLRADQIPGPATRGVLLDRIYDRGILRL